MHHRNMAMLEEILTALDIRPIVGIVPDNRSPLLEVNKPDPGFWDRVRTWQDRGWSVALHGFQHVDISGRAGVVRLNRRSEFAGLTFDEQLHRIDSGLSILRAEGITAELWMAPFCSFDQNTLAALRRVAITKISDGLAVWPWVDRNGTFWLPQQMWRFRTVPIGLWTVSLHLNYMTDAQMQELILDLREFGEQITDVKTAAEKYMGRRQSPIDRVARPLLRGAVKLRRAARAEQVS